MSYTFFMIYDGSCPAKRASVAGIDVHPQRAPHDQGVPRVVLPADAGKACPTLPGSGWEAMLRGLRGRCPRCGEARLFARFLNPVPHCPGCGQDWAHQQADDFPAYLSILVTGHLMAPLIITLIRDTQLPVGMLLAIVLSLAIGLMIGLLQPAKGGVIGLQWWLGMHGFVRERPAVGQDDGCPPHPNAEGR